jgi:hypothetical protein
MTKKEKIVYLFAIRLFVYIISMNCPQEVAQSAGTTPNKAEVTSSNPPSPFCVDMSKKKKSMNFLISTLTTKNNVRAETNVQKI